MASNESSETTKTCTKCGETKPIEAFPFSHKKSRPGYRNTQCLACRKAYRKQKYAIDPYKERAGAQAWYWQNRERSLANDKAWRASHPEEVQVRNEAYKEKRRAERRVYLILFPKKPRVRVAIDPEKIREKKRAYNRTYAEEHRSEIAMRLRTYKAMRRVQQANLQRNREARKKSLPNTFTHAQEQFCRQYFHYTCVYCGKEEGFLWCLAMDHFIPLDSPDCPGTVITNMLPACSGRDGCNISKKNRDPYVWLTWKFGKRKGAAILRTIEAYFAVAREQFS